MAEAERKVEGKAEAERKIEVYYLLIDREKKTALREVSYVELSTSATVARMKKCIKAEELITLPDSMFTVWRCLDPKLLSTMNQPQLVKELLDIDLTDVTKAKELAAGDAVKDLSVSDGELLLVQLPGAYSIFLPTICTHRMYKLPCRPIIQLLWMLIPKMTVVRVNGSGRL